MTCALIYDTLFQLISLNSFLILEPVADLVFSCSPGACMRNSILTFLSLLFYYYFSFVRFHILVVFPDAGMAAVS
jgi:hypothetical protein